MVSFGAAHTLENAEELYASLLCGGNRSLQVVSLRKGCLPLAELLMTQVVVDNFPARSPGNPFLRANDMLGFSSLCFKRKWPDSRSLPKVTQITDKIFRLGRLVVDYQCITNQLNASELNACFEQQCHAIFCYGDGSEFYFPRIN